jgi:hypothetical protein
MISLLRTCVALVFCGIVLAACNAPVSNEPTTAPAPATVAPTVGSGYPAGQNNAGGYPVAAAPTVDPAYPVPTEEITVAIVPQLTVPAPASAQVAVVTGKIFRRDKDSTENKTFPADLYLGRVLSSTQGEEGLVELDPSTAPRAQVDAQGTFVFTDIPPGKYGLFLNTPGGALLLNQPTDGSALVVDATGGQTIDLGELSYELETF